MMPPMAIYLDDQPLELQDADLESALASATAHLAATGRVVVEVQLDGEPLVGDALDQQQTTVLGDLELRLYSADPQELSVLTLRQIRDRLEDAREAQAQAAQLLQEDQQSLAMGQVMRVIEIWQQTQQAVLHCVQLLGVDLDGKQIDGHSVTQVTDALLEQLRGLRSLLSSRDTVGLADVMAYEWPGTVDQWDRFVTQLIGWIQQDCGRDTLS